MPKPKLAFGRQPNWERLRALKWAVPATLLLILGLTMYYTVPPDSQGVVLRFGRFSSIEDPGLHFKLPLGIDSVQTVPVKRQLKLEFGSADATHHRQPFLSSGGVPTCETNVRNPSHRPAMTSCEPQNSSHGRPKPFIGPHETS